MESKIVLKQRVLRIDLRSVNFQLSHVCWMMAHCQSFEIRISTVNCIAESKKVYSTEILLNTATIREVTSTEITDKQNKRTITH